MASQLDRIERMLAALCDHFGVHDMNASVSHTAIDLDTENGHRYQGVVSRFEHGWGFIECGELGRNFFVHYRDVEGTGLRKLEAGEEVSFEIGPGKDGRPKAVRVRHEGTGHPSSGPQMAPVSSEETSRKESSPAKVAGGEEENDLPLPELSVMLPPRMPAGRATSRHSRFGTARNRRPAISW